MTVTNRGGSRVEVQSNSGSRASTAEMDDVDSGLSRLKMFSDENVSLASDSVFLEDSYTNVKSELELDALEFEAESWSCAVEPQYLKKQKKEVLKRQDVIYELMQTEMHHVRTLKIMLRVYSRALSEELQYGYKDIYQIFPCVDDLLELHVNFLARFKERRKESMEEGSDKNYVIQKVGDILVQQFSGDSGERMREKYGIFCSQHNQAVSRYKDLLRDSKKFQNLMKKIGNSSIVRRLGIQECILLVTQRITKYPVLVERIIQHTEEGTEDYEALTQAIALIKNTITDVDSRVHESEKVHRLREIISKMELKSSGKLKNGLTLTKQDILRRHLLHDGVLYWKTASGRLKDILAVLLTDNLLLLQEKDQKYALSPVDNKTPMISLQKLIVREVANEEKAMFLISASNTGAEMYEIHTNSKEERNLWMTLIRGAVESCPIQDTEILNEAEEEKKLFTERAAKIKEFQVSLNQKDCAIVQSLNEKLQTCIEMAELYGYEDFSPEQRITLLPRADTDENFEGKGILQSAVTTAERIHYMLLSQTALLNPLGEANNPATTLLRRSETFGGYDTDSFKQMVKDRRAASISADSQVQDPPIIEPEVSTVDNRLPVCHETEMVVCVEMLLQHLYSLQAVISQQDSYVEVQKEREKQFRQQSSRGNILLEQEKQRNFEKQREELVNVQKMQEQLRLEKLKWERERERHQKEAEATENMLRQRMGDSELQMRKLLQEREELDGQRKEYQLDLERLRESQKAVEKDRERLELLKRIRVTSAGAGSFSSDLIPVPHPTTSNGEGMLSTEGPSHLPIKPHAKTIMSMSAADYLVRPEVVRRESNMTDIRPALKKEVPINLLSATNQIQKQVAMTRQKIPTHLALDKVKEKPSRGKASHRTESTASLDHRLGFPSKLSGKEDGTVRSRRSASPNPLSSQTVFFQQDPVGQAEPSETPLYTPVLYRPGSFHILPPSFPPQPPPPPTEDEGSKENVIFF
ncbi:rho guanine nucleotide exchange factor 18 isoform X1 [Xenopus laevis]|nr:rho guanine nucleotide exchange factor 18 isoform X1 [Xenopus laevis]OCT97636.1 hypothetical protein XELAEV_18009865mg [Xenopus laevis]